MKKYGLFHEQLVTDGNKAWYIEFSSKLLMEMDIASCEVSVIGEIPGLDCYNDAYRFFVYSNNKLFFLPFKSNIFLKYDLVEKKFSKCDIKTHIIYDELYLYSGVVFGDCIYAFGKMPFMLKLNYVTGEVRLDEACENMVPTNENIDVWFNRDYCVFDEHIYMLVYGKQMVFDYDMNSEKFACIIFEAESSEVQFSGICFDGKMFWMTSRNANSKVEMFTFSPETKKICRLETNGVLGEVGDQDVPYFLRIYNKNVFLIPCNIKENAKCLIYEIEKNKLYEKDIYLAKEIHNAILHREHVGPYLYRDYYSSVATYKKDNVVMINPWYGKRVIWYLATGAIVFDDIKISSDVEDTIFEKVIKKNSVLEFEMSLDKFMANI